MFIPPDVAFQPSYRAPLNPCLRQTIHLILHPLRVESLTLPIASVAFGLLGRPLSPVLIETVRPARGNLFLSFAGLVYLFYGQEEFVWALGAGALSLLGAAAFRVGEDVHAARTE